MSRSAGYSCRECGSVQTVWSGRCNDCGSWNTLEQVRHDLGHFAQKSASKKNRSRKDALSLKSLSAEVSPAEMHPIGIAEFDRVLGGGLVSGGAVLIGGDPGIGKSTLLLQTATLVGQHHNTVYLSGEESAAQIMLRARRLGQSAPHLRIAVETSVETILVGLEQAKPSLVVIDSIQSLYLSSIESAPGTVSQVRATAHLLINAARKYGFSLVLIGHVTKDGALAGPRVLEHMVDAVLSFEGDRSQQFRLLRALKNRFGSCEEIGVFTMTSTGLEQVDNPSTLFLGHRQQPIPGTCVIPSLEGSRPILVEVQALVAASPFAAPRRSAIGWDANRLAMILAVLEKRFRINFSRQDVYLNVTGGYRLQEPAADLAVAIALLSSRADCNVPTDLLAFGEIGLSGEVRAVPGAELRLREASRLGFADAFTPQNCSHDKITLHPCADLEPLMKRFPVDETPDDWAYSRSHAAAGLDPLKMETSHG